MQQKSSKQKRGGGAGLSEMEVYEETVPSHSKVLTNQTPNPLSRRHQDHASECRCLPTYRPHLCSATPPRDWLPATLIDAGGSSSLSAAQPPCFPSCTGTQLQEINAAAAPATHRERRHRRDRRASPTAPIPPSARGFLPGRSSARSSAARPSRSLRVAPPRRHRRGKRRRR
ncbi:hypothetical protein DEO72_LG6g1893 [Vigna unguiculata]|uniref:Uncharacterized protein n=1 Tax=Vigna unguiculata TaxID=3917 RepID=A0A4D6M8P1_VIGUN|nr:hypothetical protein DEO72_LG6g1893 [Vigna unguiculata]